MNRVLTFRKAFSQEIKNPFQRVCRLQNRNLSKIVDERPGEESVRPFQREVNKQKFGQESHAAASRGMNWGYGIAGIIAAGCLFFFYRRFSSTAGAYHEARDYERNANALLHPRGKSGSLTNPKLDQDLNPKI